MWHIFSVQKRHPATHFPPLVSHALGPPALLGRAESISKRAAWETRISEPQSSSSSLRREPLTVDCCLCSLAAASGPKHPAWQAYSAHALAVLLLTLRWFLLTPQCFIWPQGLSGAPSGPKDNAWEAYFSNPADYWDNRNRKTNPKAPDFKNKNNNEVRRCVVCVSLCQRGGWIWSYFSVTNGLKWSQIRGRSETN